jgi:hypothetical protein
MEIGRQSVRRHRTQGVQRIVSETVGRHPAPPSRPRHDKQSEFLKTLHVAQDGSSTDAPQSRQFVMPDRRFVFRPVVARGYEGDEP